MPNLTGDPESGNNLPRQGSALGARGRALLPLIGIFVLSTFGLHPSLAARVDLQNEAKTALPAPLILVKVSNPAHAVKGWQSLLFALNELFDVPVGLDLESDFLSAGHLGKYLNEEALNIDAEIGSRYNFAPSFDIVGGCSSFVEAKDRRADSIPIIVTSARNSLEFYRMNDNFRTMRGYEFLAGKFDGVFSGAEEPTSRPPQREREQDKKAVGDFQAMPENRPVFGSLIASIVTIMVADAVYRRARLIGVVLGLYGFAGILFGIDAWSLIEGWLGQ